MNPLELLSPAGDLEIFKSVINAGADAVYFGGDLFGARAYAKNFSLEDAETAIKYAHLHNSKAYLTVNTLLKNLEIEKQLYGYLKSYVELGIDAFIVQDMGVFQLIKDCFPDTALHASTQMSICTKYGADFIENLGASRIVTARELSLDEISAIHTQCPDLEIESFVHGALCVCYSGQCLMSSIIGGRSGNRGRCAQPCRLPYDIFSVDGKKLNSKGNYVLSPKDFCTIEFLPQMIETGVSSFKIEGRMKKKEYAAGVVSVYRHYIDQYLYKGKNNYCVDKADMQKLLDFGNRSGFTSLYLNKHNGPEMITFEEPSHSKNTETIVDIEDKKLKVSCKVKAKLGENFKVVFYDEFGREGESLGSIVEPSLTHPASKEEIVKCVSQLGNTDFSLSNISVEYDDNIFLPVSVVKKARREAILDYESKLIGKADKTILNFKELSFERNNIKNNTDNVFVAVSTKEQLLEVSKHDFVSQIAVPLDLSGFACSNKNNKEIILKMPEVLRDNQCENIDIKSLKIDGIMASSIDALGFLQELGYPKEKIYLDHRLYSYSNRAIRSFESNGYLHNCIPYELSLKELAHRDNSKSQMIVYSRIPLMITANCNIKNTLGCNKQNSTYLIKDRKDQTFLGKCDCDNCYNIIYNSKVYIAFGLKEEISRLGIGQLRLDFSQETAKEVADIMNSFEATFINDDKFNCDFPYTKGHLNRGVE